MRVTILCSSPEHPINVYLFDWMERNKNEHIIEIVRSKNDIHGGDILFLISCEEIIKSEDRAPYAKSLILHASDLPRGRGWSPHVWEILEGAEKITLSLLEAEDKVDSGKIWKKIEIPIPKNALFQEINHRLFSAELKLMDFALKSFHFIKPQSQSENVDATYYRRRTPEDSRLDPHKSIAEQFDLLRVCDPIRFPAFFEYRGRQYTLKLEKFEDE